MNSLDAVMTKKPAPLMNLRIPYKLRLEYRAASRMIGFHSTTSAIHHHMVNTVNEQRKQQPEKFNQTLGKVISEEITSADDRRKGLSPDIREELLAMFEEEYSGASEEVRQIIERARQKLTTENPSSNKKPRKHKDS